MNSLHKFIGLTALLVGALSGHAAVAVLEWNPNGETNLAGYRVHAGSASRAYGLVADVGLVTAYTNEFAPGLHFLAVTAYDCDGLESAFSEEIALHVVAPPAPRWESNVLTWEGSGTWRVRWTSPSDTNTQTLLTNRMSADLFPVGSQIVVQRYELGASNVLSDYSAPITAEVPVVASALQLRVVLERSGGVNMPFHPFAEAHFYDGADGSAFYRARLEITRTGLRLR